MTQRRRIEELERKVAELAAELQLHKAMAHPPYVIVPYPQPSPVYPQPQYPWLSPFTWQGPNVLCLSDGGSVP